MKNLLYAQNIYLYAQAAYSAKTVYVRTLRFNVKKPYNLHKAAYIAQKPYNLRTQTATAVSKNW